MPNAFVHSELATTDLAKARSFYGALFDWKFDDAPMPDGIYTMIDIGENQYGVGGGMYKATPDAKPGWLTYVAVDDAKAATEKVRSLGGTVYREATAVPGMGWLSIVADPMGAVFGLWAADANAK